MDHLYKRTVKKLLESRISIMGGELVGCFFPFRLGSGDGNGSGSARIIHTPTLFRILVELFSFSLPPLEVGLCILQVCPDSNSRTSNGVGYGVRLLSNFIAVILY